MSHFNFPEERSKYEQISNISILLAMLKEDARKDPSIRINPFKVTTYHKYGYIKTVVARCKYCNAVLKYRSVRTETDHLKDQNRFNNESSHSNPSYEKIVKVTYKLREYNSNHEHNQENAGQEQQKRKKQQRNQQILEFYENLLKEKANPNSIKTQLKRKFMISDHEIYKILHPFQTIQRQYSIAKQKMRNMNFTIIEKFQDLIDISKIKNNSSSYIEFPSQFTIITPTMVDNYVRYGQTVYFGVYPQYISQSKKLILVGGFYGINEHHIFVPLANVILTLFKKEEQIIVFSNLLDIIDKQDDEIVKTLISIFRTFFSYYNTKVQNRNLLLVVRQTNNTQAAIYQMRKQFPNLNFIYCFREKLNNLQLEVNKRYCNDSYSSQEKLDFITALYAMVKTLEEEEYNHYLKSLFKKANTNNTLLLQKITEDSHLFCFSKIKDPSNNLYEQCIDEFMRRKFEGVINNEVKSKHQFMRNIMAIINSVIVFEKDNTKTKKQDLKLAIYESDCSECQSYYQSRRQQLFNQVQLFERKVPELRGLKQKICVKTFYLIMKQLVKCLSIKCTKTMDAYNDIEYFVFKNGMKYKITESQDNQGLSCDCQISKKYGIPCSHELFICINQNLKIEGQLKRWLL